MCQSHVCGLLLIKHGKCRQLQMLILANYELMIILKKKKKGGEVTRPLQPAWLTSTE